MNILVAIERLKEIAQIKPDAVVKGWDWTHEDYASPANKIFVQTDIFDMETGVYFEHDESFS